MPSTKYVILLSILILSWAKSGFAQKQFSERYPLSVVPSTMAGLANPFQARSENLLINQPIAIRADSLYRAELQAGISLPPSGNGRFFSVSAGGAVGKKVYISAGYRGRTQDAGGTPSLKSEYNSYALAAQYRIINPLTALVSFHLDQNRIASGIVKSTGFSADLALQYHKDNLAATAYLQNVGNIKAQNRFSPSAQSDSLLAGYEGEYNRREAQYQTIGLSLAYRLAAGKVVSLVPLLNLQAGLDKNRAVSNVQAALETDYQNRFFLRGGIITYPTKFYAKSVAPSAGLGFANRAVRLDVGYNAYYWFGNRSQVLAALSIRFK